MSMIREEIIKSYEDAVVSNGLADSAGNEAAVKSHELSKVDLDTLLAASRERMKKMRGKWMGSADGCADGELVYDIWKCSHCGYPDMLPQFCPKCCSIMTDEALEMVMKRLEALDNETQ